MHDDRVLSAISLFNEQIRELQEQTKKKQRLVNELCEEVGLPKQYEVDDGTGSGVVIQPGEFFTKPLATVVTTILQRRKQSGLTGPALIDELYPLMIDGGYVFDAKNDANAKRSLSIALAKNTKFVKLPSEHIALADWYDLPKQRAKEAEKKPAMGADPTAANAAQEDEVLAEFREEFDKPTDESKGEEPSKKKAKEPKLPKDAQAVGAGTSEAVG